MKPSLVIVGLGNPGATYERTRHNAGFQALDVLSRSYGEGEWKQSDKFDAFTQEARVGTVPVLLVKPLTFMNLSGQSVRKIVDFYKLDAKEQVIVVYDDIDIPLGEHRFRKTGSAGTHNGMRSVVESFGENVPRLRVGIGPKPAQGDLAAWVLSAISAEDAAVLAKVYASFPDLVQKYVMEEVQGD